MERDKSSNIITSNNSSINDEFDRKYLILKRGNNFTIFPRSKIDMSDGISASLSSRNLPIKNNPK